MALTEVELFKKRTEKNLRQRRALRGRRTAGLSKEIGRRRWRLHLDADELAKRNEAYEAQRAASRAAIKEALGKKRGGFVDRVKAGLLKLLPRRNP